MQKSAPTNQPIERLILQLRGHKVMLDISLAKLYGVPTGSLIQAVKRNQDRFPSDFIFQLTEQELVILKSQIVISSLERRGLWGGRRTLPYAF